MSHAMHIAHTVGIHCTMYLGIMKVGTVLGRLLGVNVNVLPY
jgi:hypothetical protein